MNPRIEIIKERRLIGKKVRMSFVKNKTRELWQSFMPGRREITNSVSQDLYSVEVYNDAEFFTNFNPSAEFEKWAAIEVKDFNSIPENMESLTLPAGKYAVFQYKGKPSEAQGVYQFIYGQWIHNSEYALDDRPHFAVMGDKYIGEDPESEEEFWIPVKKK